ncbi:hypothetical protein [Pseudoduganella chitinolytica]|uniref:Lipoprotein n=1 Tax=Pseudoduganella chitinolytica TaxID=34070 RepID=A0ABY8BB14_9BURK|nr:hypothetical protein [Pseudoduganella chitinolytica]WEF31539.1 hypothetical protein PX653_19030 [Pseudoduganella chitinolytica]
MKNAIALLLPALLACACSRQTPERPGPSASVPAAAPAPLPAAAAPQAPVQDRFALLMQAVYGNAYRAASGDALAPMPDPDNPAERWQMVLDGVSATELPTGETVLVVSGDSADENGTATGDLANPGALSLYLLRRQEGQWHVLRRHENVARLGSHGRIGKVSWVNLAAGKTGLAVEDRMANRGETAIHLALFDPTAERVADLTGGETLIRSDNDDDCDESRERCWHNVAQWRLVPGAAPYYDLVLDIDSTTTVAQAGGQRQQRSERGTARYVFADGAYRLREGSNTVGTRHGEQEQEQEQEQVRVRVQEQ